MNKIIRKSCFETNSSSSHSISLASNDKQFVLDTIYPDLNGEILVSGGDFGWGWSKHNDSITKLNYAFQDGVDIILLETVLKEQTGADKIVFSYLNDGYVDHQSYGTARDICVDEESTKNFIFNKNSWLFIGNDNGDEPIYFFDVEEYRDGEIIKFKYPYELIIENKTFRLKRIPDSEGDLYFHIRSFLHHLVYVPNDGFIYGSEYRLPLGSYYLPSYDHPYVNGGVSDGKIRFLNSQYKNVIEEIQYSIYKLPIFKNMNIEERNEHIKKQILNLPNSFIEIPFEIKKL